MQEWRIAQGRMVARAAGHQLFCVRCGKILIANFEMPPVHPNCRSVLMPSDVEDDR